jgi:hypothetical protein
MIFTFIPHHCIFPPSVRLSVSWLPFSQSPNDSMTLKALRGNGFRFFPELFTVSSHCFYHDLSTVKASITLHAPHLSVAVAFMRLVTQNDYRIHNTAADASIPGMFSLGLCQDWALASQSRPVVR